MKRSFALSLVFLSFTALAQPPEISAGTDLTSWQLLEQRRLEGEVGAEAYRSFVLTYSESPLALAAWSRLVALDGTGGDWAIDAGARETVLTLERRWRLHERVLAAHASSAPVATLFLDADATVAAPE